MRHGTTLESARGAPAAKQVRAPQLTATKASPMTDPLDEISEPPLYFDREGKPCSCRTWARLYEDRFLADDRVGEYRVATIYTGLSVGSYPPQIFETAVFRNRKILEEHPWTSEAAARRGHEMLLQKYRSEKR